MKANLENWNKKGGERKKRMKQEYKNRIKAMETEGKEKINQEKRIVKRQLVETQDIKHI